MTTQQATATLIDTIFAVLASRRADVVYTSNRVARGIESERPILERRLVRLQVAIELAEQAMAQAA